MDAIWHDGNRQADWPLTPPKGEAQARTLALMK